MAWNENKTQLMELQVAQKADNQLWEKIQGVNLARVRNRLIVKEGFSMEDAECTIVLYREYLYSTTVLDHASPSRDVDLAWHAHILHLPMYFRDCMMTFGRILWHVPTAISDEEVEAALLTPRREKAVAAEGVLAAACDDAGVCNFESCMKEYAPPVILGSDCEGVPAAQLFHTMHSIWVPKDEYANLAVFAEN